jgi:hypothetical protein
MTFSNRIKMRNLPEDLHEFLKNVPQQGRVLDGLDYGQVILKSLDEMALTTLAIRPGSQYIVDDPYDELEGAYQIRIVDLIAECEDHDPEGLFCWIEDLGVYGSINSEDSNIIIFPGVSWSVIAARPSYYFTEACDHPDGEYVMPWMHFPFRLEDGTEILPYRDICTLHQTHLSVRARTHRRRFDTFRNPTAWVQASRKQFPYAGVPISETKELFCSGCFAAEYQWATDVDETIPILDVATNSAGFVRCPQCHISFWPHHKDGTLVDRHSACGQRLNVLVREPDAI